LAKTQGHLYVETLDPEFKQYTTIMANIIRTLILERDETTLKFAGNLLLATADIDVDKQDLLMKYSEEASQVVT
jgi:hypothetical protein